MRTSTSPDSELTTRRLPRGLDEEDGGAERVISGVTIYQHILLFNAY